MASTTRSPGHATSFGGWPVSRRTRRRRTLKVIGWCLAGLVVTGGGITYWALDEYVIDHVEISDVSAYEAEVAASRATAATAAGDEDIDAAAEAAAATDTTVDGSVTGSAPIITDTTYDGDGLSIAITTVVEGEGDDRVTYYVADVEVTDATRLRAGFADNAYGENIVADTSDIAEDVGALLAINGDYYGFRDDGIMLRNGILYRDSGTRTGLAQYADGRLEVYDEASTSGTELLAAGVWNTWSFGPALLDDGEIVAGIEDVEVDTNFGNHSIQGQQPRTGIGVMDEGHLVFVVVDGRSDGYSRGVTMTEFAEIFHELGATEAYNLDGGGSSTMWFNGELVNDPLGKGDERGTSDIVYVA